MDKDIRIKELERELAECQNKNNRLEKEISSCKEYTHNLKEEMFHLKSLFNSSTSLITFLRGPHYIVEFANKPIRDVWGKGDDVIGKPLFEIIPEVREQGIEDYLNQVFYEGEPYHAEGLPLEHKVNGKMIRSSFDFTYMPQYGPDKNIIGIGVVAQDVTSREVLHQKIKKSEKEFRELIDFMPHKISLTDADGKSVFYNRCWLEYTGLTLEEFIQKPWTEIVHPEEQEKVEDHVRNCLNKGEDIDLEIRILNKNNDYKWHLYRAIPVKDENGVISSWISSSTEIQKLKAEEQRKEDFLKLVSHELKTPVTSIKGYVQLLQSMVPKETERKDVPIKPYLTRIEDQIERLIRLISEMLDLSRIESNELELKREEFSLNEHVEQIIEDLSYTHQDVQIELNHSFETSVFADKDRIGQVVINFITNALKYSPGTKKVKVNVFRKQKEVAVSVKDFGIGIKRDDLKNIFKRFYRVANKNDNTYAGFGIGLYLSNEIIERHNGKITVQSNIGEGSEFTFTLPLN